MQATKCTLANGAGVRLEFIEAGSIGLLPSYKPPLILEPGEVASFLVDKNIPFRLNYNIQTFQGPFGGWLGGDTSTAVTVTSSTVQEQINTVAQVDDTTKYPTQISFDVSTDGDFFHIFATQLIGAVLPPPGSCGEYEAEDATASGPQFESSHAGFSGTGFMDFVTNDGEYLEWRVAASSTTFIHMNWQYALKYGSRNLQLSVNGETLQEVAFPGSGSWLTWTRTSSVSARLTEGSNTIRIASNGNSGANIDQMRVCVSAYLPVGAYECHKYDGTTTKNNWHYVTVSAEGGRVRWSNRAGVSWMLTPRVDGDLDVGEKCPHYSNGYTVCKVVRNAAGSVTSLLGPSGEVYARG